MTADLQAQLAEWARVHQFEHYDDDEHYLGPCILVSDLPALAALVSAHVAQVREGLADDKCQECGSTITAERAAELGYYDGSNL